MDNNSGKTLQVLAEELARIFDFDYLTLDLTPYLTLSLRLWKSERKSFFSERRTNGFPRRFECIEIPCRILKERLDLPEDKENGSIDFSKCIVRVR